MTRGRLKADRKPGNVEKQKLAQLAVVMDLTGRVHKNPLCHSHL